MGSKLLFTVAAAAFSAALAANGAFAQDEQIPKHKQLQQGESPNTQQEPTNKMEAPKKRLDQSQQEPATQQPKRTEQNGESAKKPVRNTEQTAPTDRNQSQPGCAEGQEANCPPKTQRMGKEQPGTKSKTHLGQQQPEDQAQPHKKRLTNENAQQPEDQAQPHKKRLTNENAQQPAAPGTKSDQTQTGSIGTGETRTGNRGNVNVLGSINVPRDKASRVSEELFRSGERSNVDVGVNLDVGVVLPERVHPRPLPADIVEIVPEYRDYDYVVVQDEIVIVQPQTRKVVEIIRRGGGGTGHARAASNIRLTAEQRQEIVAYARQHRTSGDEPSFDAEAGVSVPGDVELMPLPDSVVTEVPAIRSYDFFVGQDDEVVLVDPDSRAVVDVIQ